MAEFKPTASQQAAIRARGSALLVSAGAGSGKTKVLTERLLSRITDEKEPADLDHFLIITFTKAAAGELRGRIFDELTKAMAADPGNRHLRRQSALCRRAQIGTIHSFCAAVLREFSHVAGISPDFKIIEDDRAAPMKAAALERVLDQRYESPEKYPGFTLLADTVGAGRDDNRLAELVLSLYEKMQCHARPELWAKSQVELLAGSPADAGETVWGKELLSSAKETAEYWAGELDRLMGEMTGDSRLCAAYLPSIVKGADDIRELSRRLSLGWESARAGLPVKFDKLGALRGPDDPELAERVKLRKEACKKAMDKLETAFSSPSEELTAQMKLTEPAMEALLALTLDFGARFAAEKRRCSLADYSDLEHLAAKLLTDENGSPTETARQIAGRYTEIMVDEYQDVSLVQDAIFSAVSKGGSNLFFVGDVKQAIYRFRLADPEIFTKKYLSYGDSPAPGQPQRIMLQENFRSRREIIDCANSIFSNCMSRSLGDIDYDGAARLVQGASYPGSVPKPEIMLLSMSAPEADKGEGESENENPSRSALEAELVAKKIRRLIDSGTLVTGSDGQRPMEYGDIAVILRAPSSVGAVYRRVFAQYGIPSSAGQGGFFSAVEVSAVTGMLAVIDNPHQDIPLLAVLRSPAFGFTADELAQIRAADKEHDFYSAMTAAAQGQKKCADFLQRLCRLRGFAADLSAAELVWLVTEELDMLAICSAMSDGAARRANVLELVGLAEKFEQSGYRGLHRFVLWLRRQAQKGNEPSVGSQGSAIHLMSVHKSKGLEFPVVFLCDTARQFNRSDSSKTVLVHPTLGLGPKVTDLGRRVEYPTLARRAIALRQSRELLSEEMRLAYVAVTRARERLFITGAVNDGQKLLFEAASSVTSPMAPQVLAAVSSPLKWFVYAYLADEGKSMELNVYKPDGDSAETPPQPEKASLDREVYDALCRNLSYVYPHDQATRLPSKVTATELKGREEKDEDGVSLLPAGHSSFTLPDFARDRRPMTGAEKGVATHLVLQYIDYSRATTLEGIREEVARLLNARFISPREAQAVDTGAVLRLFTSPLGRRMLSADALVREFKFSLLCPAGELLPTDERDEVLLQGVVDCCMEENGELVIVDYKTDSVTRPEEIARRTRHYSAQLKAYAAALTRIFNKRVKECIVYFISAGRAEKIQ